MCVHVYIWNWNILIFFSLFTHLLPVMLVPLLVFEQASVYYSCNTNTGGVPWVAQTFRQHAPECGMTSTNMFSITARLPISWLCFLFHYKYKTCQNCLRGDFFIMCEVFSSIVNLFCRIFILQRMCELKITVFISEAMYMFTETC